MIRLWNHFVHSLKNSRQFLSSLSEADSVFFLNLNDVLSTRPSRRPEAASAVPKTGCHQVNEMANTSQLDTYLHTSAWLVYIHIHARLCLYYIDILRLMHDGTGLQRLQRRGEGQPRNDRTLAEVHLADSLARYSVTGSFFVKSLNKICQILRANASCDTWTKLSKDVWGINAWRLISLLQRNCLGSFLLLKR